MGFCLTSVASLNITIKDYQLKTKTIKTKTTMLINYICLSGRCISLHGKKVFLVGKKIGSIGCKQTRFTHSESIEILVRYKKLIYLCIQWLSRFTWNFLWRKLHGIGGFFLKHDVFPCFTELVLYYPNLRLWSGLPFHGCTHKAFNENEKMPTQLKPPWLRLLILCG